MQKILLLNVEGELDLPSSKQLKFLGYPTKFHCEVYKDVIGKNASSLGLVVLDDVWEPATTEWQFVDVRSFFTKARKYLRLPLCRALQLGHWFMNNQYCGRTGVACNPDADEVCMVSEGGEHKWYPKLSPCILARVTRDDEILLGRPAHFPQGMYSIIAGFVEAGENLEQAVVREVYEESGLKVEAVNYVASESWPFPAQLMLGFSCVWKSGEVRLPEEELEDVRWFNKKDMPLIPPAEFSLSGSLIKSWLDN